MFCTDCGTKFEGKFCPVCGTPAAQVSTDPNTLRGKPTMSESEKLEFPFELEETGYFKQKIIVVKDAVIISKMGKEERIPVANITGAEFHEATLMQNGCIIIKTANFDTVPKTAPTAQNAVVFTNSGNKKFKDICEKINATVLKGTCETVQNLPSLSHISCPRCTGNEIHISLEVVGQKNVKKKNSILRDAARTTAIIGTAGIWGLTQKHDGVERSKIEHQKIAVCQSCGHSWEVK